MDADDKVKRFESAQRNPTTSQLVFVEMLVRDELDIEPDRIEELRMLRCPYIRDTTVNHFRLRACDPVDVLLPCRCRLRRPKEALG